MPTNPHPTPRPGLRPETRVLLAVLGVFLFGLPATFWWAAEQVLFDPQAYKDALEAQEIYHDFPLLAGEALTEGADDLLGVDAEQLLDALEQSNYDAVMRQVFPPDWVRAQSESLIDQLLAYLNFETDQLVLLVDFRPVKAHLGGQGSAEVASIIVSGLPLCDAQELLEFTLRALTGQAEGLPLCRPPDLFIGLANLLVSGLLQGFALALPEQVDLAGSLRLAALASGGRSDAVLSAWFGLYRVFRMVGPLLPWLALLCLALTGFFARKTARGPLYWLGAGLLLPGMAALLMALLLGLTSGLIIPALVGQFVGPSPILFTPLVEMLTTVNAQFIREAASLGITSAVLGAAVLAASLWFGGQKEATAE
jgi:hypothetical protein